MSTTTVPTTFSRAIHAVDTVAPSANRRPAAFGRRGMVASAHPVAASAGIQVLLEGGNAFDAAIATALVEGVVLPAACGLGGDMFAVLYDSRSDQFRAINGSGIAPRAASAEYYLERGHSTMPLDGIHSVSVPGAVDAYLTLHRHFGTFPLERLFAPAIEVAANGFAVTTRLASALRKPSAGHLHRHPTSERTFFPGGQAPRGGDILRRPQLARTLGLVARGGSDAFYRGEIASEIVDFSRANGGLFTREDFADQQTELYTPIKTTYRGVEVHATAPVSQGLIVLEWLNLLEGFPMADYPSLSTDEIHVMVEAKKLAYADRLDHCGDPRYVDIPLDRLISKQHAAARRGAIDLNRAAPSGRTLESVRGDTSYFCVADGQGNAISFIHSLSAGFGSGVVAGETGILLNNRGGRGFSLEDGHPNRLVGGRRTMHTLNCYLLAEGGKPVLVGGTPGGDQQPQWNVQMVVGMLDHGLDPQSVIEAPRWFSFPGTDPEHVHKPGELRLEGRVSDETVRGLRERGHDVKLLGPWEGGGAVQLIALDQERGTLLGGTDPRVDGVALGI